MLTSPFSERVSESKLDPSSPLAGRQPRVGLLYIPGILLSVVSMASSLRSFLLVLQALSSSCGSFG